MLCRGPESNRYDVNHRRILSPVRLPVPPPRLLTSERRDSNPRPPPWQGDVLPLNYVRILLMPAT